MWRLLHGLHVKMATYGMMAKTSAITLGQYAFDGPCSQLRESARAPEWQQWVRGQTSKGDVTRHAEANPAVGGKASRAPFAESAMPVLIPI